VSDLLTIEEAGARLRCSRARVFQLLADGVLVRGRKYGKRTVVTAASVASALLAPEAPSDTPVVAPRPPAPKSHAAELAAVSARQRQAWKKPRGKRSAA